MLFPVFFFFSFHLCSKRLLNRCYLSLARWPTNSTSIGGGSARRLVRTCLRSRSCRSASRSPHSNHCTPIAEEEQKSERERGEGGTLFASVAKPSVTRGCEPEEARFRPAAPRKNRTGVATDSARLTSACRFEASSRIFAAGTPGRIIQHTHGSSAAGDGSFAENSVSRKETRSRRQHRQRLHFRCRPGSL